MAAGAYRPHAHLDTQQTPAFVIKPFVAVHKHLLYCLLFYDTALGVLDLLVHQSKKGHCRLLMLLFCKLPKGLMKAAPNMFALGLMWKLHIIFTVRIR